MAATLHAGLTPRRILCATDFSPSAMAALPQAARLAKIAGARLYLAHVIEIPAWEIRAEPTLQMRAAATGRLERAMAAPELRGISAHTILGHGSVTAGILRLAQETAADLVVTGTRSRHGLRHFLAPSAAEQLALSAPCPLLAVGPCARSTTVHAPFRSIVLATLLNPGAAAGIGYARWFAQAQGAKLWVAHPLNPRASLDETDAANRWLRKLAPDQPGVERVAEAGSVEQVTIALAERESADLVMLGPGLGERLAPIAREVACPVMAVRYAIPMIRPKSSAAELAGSHKESQK